MASPQLTPLVSSPSTFRELSLPLPLTHSSDFVPDYCCTKYQSLINLHITSASFLCQL